MSIIIKSPNHELRLLESHSTKSGSPPLKEQTPTRDPSLTAHTNIIYFHQTSAQNPQNDNFITGRFDIHL
jgi:hypothetical protein